MSVGGGLRCFLQGARLAWAPSLRAFVLWPMAVSLLLVVALLGLGFSFVRDATAAVVEWLPDWLDWLGKVLAPVLYALGLLVAGWLFGFVAVLAASPFLGVLSARAERLAFGDGPREVEGGVWHAVVGAFAREGRKLAYHLPRLALVLAIGFVPVLNAAAPALWFAFGAWMLAVQFVDYAAENRGLGFAATLALLHANRAAALGFGALATLLLAVPFGALFVIPAAVSGGAVLWRRCAGAGGAPPVARTLRQPSREKL